MTPAEITTYIENHLSITASTDFSDLLTVMNVKMDNISSKIAKATQGQYFGAYGYMNLVASTTAANREYRLPADILNRLIMVNLMLDGSTYKRARFTDINRIKDFKLQEADITNNYSNDKPWVFIFRQSLFVLSGTTTAVTNGIQYWYVNFLPKIASLTNSYDLAEATDTTSSPQQGFPRQFHELLGQACIIEFKERNGIPFVGRESFFDSDLIETLDELTPLVTDEEEMGVLPDDGSDNGYNY